MVATLLWMLGCATNEAPSSSQRESPAEDPRAEAAALDARTPLPLTPQMAEHQKVQMRDHLVAVSEITAGLAASDWAGVEAAALRLGTSPGSETMCEHMGAGAPGFTERGIGFHTTADGIVGAARAHDGAAVTAALAATLAGCTGCHAEYRQEVVTEAAYAAAAAAAEAPVETPAETPIVGDETSMKH